MAEDSDKEAKTEEPTEKRLRDAIEKGNLPHSREIQLFSGLFAMLIIGQLWLQRGTAGLLTPLAQFFEAAGEIDFHALSDVGGALSVSLSSMAWFLLPCVLVFIGFGVAAAFAQHVPTFDLDRITPKFSRISPQSGFKRLFALNGLIEFTKSLLKLLAISFVVFLILRSELDRLIETLAHDPSEIGPYMLSLGNRLVMTLSVGVGVIASADLVWARIKWRRDLRMSKQEIKDEFKEAEGDPILKAKMRSLAQDRIRRNMMAAVPKATLVIANPTHYAIALRYSREEGGAPKVLAKGQDLIALRIREIAEANDVPVIEDKPLARSMYDLVEIDHYIPSAFYKAVAALIHTLHKQGRSGLLSPKAQ